MGHAEWHRNSWRARWSGPDGNRPAKSGFRTKRDAEKYANDQEAAIRAETYVDPRSGHITVTNWVNELFPSLDLEPSTLSNYRYFLEVHVLPKFGDSALSSITSRDVATWEKGLKRSGLSERTARDARSTFGTMLEEAIPEHIKTNPAARKKGKGRKGQRRIERLTKEEKVWADPLQILLVAERASTLSGDDTDFVKSVTIAYTGCRWGEALALSREHVKKKSLDIHWKLYELNGKFYRGRPKDGSMRTADLPPFLSALLETYLDTHPPRRCTCKGVPADGIDWCAGQEYMFLGPKGGHARRSNYSERVIRPAADGWYPARKGIHARPAMPVLVDLAQSWPGKPLVPWPAALPAQVTYEPPTGRGRPAIPADAVLASWAPISSGLTAHGCRHGHQTWLDEIGTPRVLSAERMGHELPGMHGVYAHVSSGMRVHLIDSLQRLWEESLDARLKIAPRSGVGILDALLVSRRAQRLAS